MKSVLVILLFLFTSMASHASENYTVTPVDFNLPNGWLLGEVVGVVEDKRGHRFIFNRGQHQLLEFDSKGRFVKELGKGNFAKPHGLRLDRHGNIWTADIETQLVQRFSPAGDVTMVLGMKNKASKGWFDRDYNLVLFNSPHDVAFDRFDNIYVVDKGNDRIVKLNPNGLLIKTWGKKGSDKGEFNFAHAIVIDDQDRVLIADRENKRIQVFDLEGKYLQQWQDIGYPYVLTLSNNKLWMTDARNEVIQQLDSNGRVVKKIEGDKGRNSNQFGFAHGIHVTKQENILVTQVLNWSVL